MDQPFRTATSPAVLNFTAGDRFDWFLLLVASLLLVVMPGAPSSFLLLVVRPGAPSSVLVRDMNEKKHDFTSRSWLISESTTEKPLSPLKGLKEFDKTRL